MIETIGRALYGECWQRPMARALGTDRRMIQKWTHGRPIPEGVLRDLYELLRQRDIESATLRYQLHKEITPDD